MTGRTFEESQKIRSWIESAISDGAKSPTSVLEWIERRKEKDESAPSLGTIIRIMTEEMGYERKSADWIRKGK
jgi:hypothetical protein